MFGKYCFNLNNNSEHSYIENNSTAKTVFSFDCKKDSCNGLQYIEAIE